MLESLDIKVSSEIEPLRKVIVHRPDNAIARISPKRAEELLFDDIVHLPRMQEEHDIFVEVLAAFLGKENIYEVTDLIAEGLAADEAKKLEIVKHTIEFEELPKKFIEKLNALDSKALAEVLVTGYLPAEDYILFDPIPNFIFTRDIAVSINDHILITKAAKSARFRENLLARFIFWSHPYFSHLHEKGKVINLNNIDEFPPSKKGESISAEGGDIMILNKDTLLIGCSERTTEYSVEQLKKALFDKGVVKNVVQINIPADRSFMHIDTIFTHINTNHIAAYKPIIVDGMSSKVIVHTDQNERREYHSVREYFHAEINSDMEFILSGKGESPYQEREQWTDGCNLVALRPGVALTYDRNPVTDEAFREQGYDVIHALDFLRKYKNGEIDPASIENTIITLPSNELSRARGGSHCMTCPIVRG